MICQNAYAYLCAFSYKKARVGSFSPLAGRVWKHAIDSAGRPADPCIHRLAWYNRYEDKTRSLGHRAILRIGRHPYFFPKHTRGQHDSDQGPHFSLCDTLRCFLRFPPSFVHISPAEVHPSFVKNCKFPSIHGSASVKILVSPFAALFLLTENDS